MLTTYVPTTDMKGTPKYPSTKPMKNIPMFDGDPLSTAHHVVRFIRYISKKNITQACDQMELFVLSIAPSTDGLESCKPKSIPSLPMLTTHFLLHEGPSFQSHEDISQIRYDPSREEVIEYGFMLEEEPLIDAYFNDDAKGETHELEIMSSKNNKEDFNPESP